VRCTSLRDQDYTTGQTFEHQRGWIAQRIQELAAIFAIATTAYKLI
jgi:hypothetical protein